MPRENIADQLVAKIVSVSEQATDKDRELVAEWKAKAVASAGNPVQAWVDMTPVCAALLFIEANQYNRDWDAPYTGRIASVMLAGYWRNHSPQGYSLFNDGTPADGRHRLGGQAVSGITVIVSMTFGVDKEIAGVIDNGKIRKPPDIAALAGVADADDKMAVLNGIWTYEKKAKMPVGVIKGNTPEIVREIQDNDALLTRALEIGRLSIQDISGAWIKEKDAAKLAGVLLKHGWPEDQVIDTLDSLQRAEFPGDNHPLAVAYRYISDHRKPLDVIEKENERGVLVKALLMSLTRQTVTPRGKAEIVMGEKHAPVPTYPAPPPPRGFAD